MTDRDGVQLHVGDKVMVTLSKLNVEGRVVEIKKRSFTVRLDSDKVDKHQIITRRSHQVKII